MVTSPNNDVRAMQQPTIGYIDARSTDPARTRENVNRAIAEKDRNTAKATAARMQNRAWRTPH